MNKQMKILLVVLVLIASIVTITYAVQPDEPNLPILVANIYTEVQNIASSLSTHDTDIKARLDTLDESIADIPIMETTSGYVTDINEGPELVRFVIYESPEYPNGAVFHVIVKGSTTGSAAIYVKSVIPFGNEQEMETSLPEFLTGDELFPVSLEFPGSKCKIVCLAPSDSVFSAYYYVATTYVP